MIRTCAGDPSEWLCQYRGKRPLFACILSFTETGLIPHISAAGGSLQARRYTAIADGELLASSRILPRFPLKAGISPAVISRAILTQQGIPFHLLSTGLPDKLAAPHIVLPQVMAKALYTGQAMTLKQVEALFESGLLWGKRLAQQCLGSYLILGECVVGGTTTAQAMLTALGYHVAGRMSSSHSSRCIHHHEQKQKLVNQGLHQWQQNRSAFQSTPLAAVAACGDPMQAVAAGIALAASQQVGVLLAGGAQMLAIYALAQAIAHRHQEISWQNQRIVVGTTRWVIEDASADTTAIARDIGAPYIASEISFAQSSYRQLRAYEQGFVKEGVGAGGCAIAAHLYKGWNRSQLRHAVETELRDCF
ncbi:MAG: TIGR00303 family protein [Phormidesmis sp.]